MRTLATRMLVLLVVGALGCTSPANDQGLPPASGASSTDSISTPGASATPPSAPASEDDQLSVPVPAPGGVVSAFGSIWAQSKPHGSLWRIAPDGRILAKIAHVSRNSGEGVGQQTIVAGYGAIWTLVNDAVVRIDPATNQPVGRIAVAPYSDFLAAGMGSIWVACCGPSPSANNRPKLQRIDTTTNAITSETNLPTSPGGLATGAGSVWWINYSEAASISKIDPVTGHDVYLQTSAIRPLFVIMASRYTWLVDANGGISSLPRKSGEPAHPVKVALQTLGVTVGHGSVWINGGDLVGFDPANGKVTTYIPVAGQQPPQVLAGIAVLRNRVWLADVAGQRVVGVRV